MLSSERFVRLPTELLEHLLTLRLSGVEFRILLWIARQSYGWNRNKTPFTWYRIAKDLLIDRGGAVRAGHKLLRASLLCTQDGQIGIQEGFGEWDRAALAGRASKADELLLTGVSADTYQRNAATGVIASDDAHQQRRCRTSAVFRRAKDSSKEALKTFKSIRQESDGASRRKNAEEVAKRPRLAGTADPIPGKYDGISEN